MISYRTSMCLFYAGGWIFGIHAAFDLPFIAISVSSFVAGEICAAAHEEGW